MIEDDNNHDLSPTKGTGGAARNKKRDSTTLIDVVSILASAKTSAEDRKFDFLSEHLQQQGEWRQKELDMERERLAIEREKTEMEKMKTELMMQQLEASLQTRPSQVRVSKAKGKEIMVVESEDG